MNLLRDPKQYHIVPGMAFRELAASPEMVVKGTPQGSGTGVSSARRNTRDEVPFDMDHGSKWREQSRTDGSWWEIGFSCPACQPKTEQYRVDDASFVGESESDDRHENICCTLCRRRSTRGRLSTSEIWPVWGTSARRPECPSVTILSSGHAVPATPRFRVAGCKTHPMDNLFQHTEGKSC